MRKEYHLAQIAYCAAILLFTGCSESTKHYPIAGQVLIDGKPVPAGTIQFVPESGRPYSSKIDQEGYFSLTDDVSGGAQKAGGVPAGKYRLGISSMRVINEDEGEVEQHIPPSYADFRKSELEVQVTGEDRNLVIELTWDGAERMDHEKASTESDNESAVEQDDKEGEQE
ncbi:MAG: hypothetical protein RH917_02855 [Lacipirellulaceae bacterium]